MKVARGISLFVIAVGLFAIGCFLGFEGHSFFYPGVSAEKSRSGTAASASDEKMECMNCVASPGRTC